MAEEIIGGAIIVAGVVVIVAAAMARLPFVAGLGALTSAGTGLYEAVSARRRKRARQD
jgi:hypothetical protein